MLILKISQQTQGVDAQWVKGIGQFWLSFYLSIRTDEFITLFRLFCVCLDGQRLSLLIILVPSSLLLWLQQLRPLSFQPHSQKWLLSTLNSRPEDMLLQDRNNNLKAIYIHITSEGLHIVPWMYHKHIQELLPLNQYPR